MKSITKFGFLESTLRTDNWGNTILFGGSHFAHGTVMVLPLHTTNG